MSGRVLTHLDKVWHSRKNVYWFNVDETQPVMGT